MVIARPVFWSVVLLLTTPLLIAQATPDFSGVFLRTSITEKAPSSKTGLLHKVAPVILGVSQSGERLEITSLLNGETFTSHYHLGDVPNQPNVETAEIKGKNLVIKSQADLPAHPESVVLVPVQASSYPTAILATEKWELSRDLQTLTIRRKVEHIAGKTVLFGSGYEYTETFVRQVSLQSAMEQARGSEHECNSKPPLAASAKNGKVRYDDGVEIGSSLFQQISRCISFSATLSAKQFVGLEQVATSRGNEFRRDYKPVTLFPEIVTLEISPSSICSTGWRSETGPLSVGPDLSDLEFKVEWLGPIDKDLGTVKAELLREPWQEQNPSDQFFRLQVPAKDVPFSDSLEVRIFDNGGRQLGCIAGHI